MTGGAGGAETGHDVEATAGEEPGYTTHGTRSGAPAASNDDDASRPTFLLSFFLSFFFLGLEEGMPSAPARRCCQEGP